MKAISTFALLIVLLVPICSFAQGSWLTDEEARKAAEAAVRSESPEKCYNTYRKEGLEGWVFSLRAEKIADQEPNYSVYMYEVDAESCEYVTQESGKPVLHLDVKSDCCWYGLVAVDRRTKNAYWFHPYDKRAEVFRRFARDEQLLPGDGPELYASLYRELVWGDGSNELTALTQLRRLAEENFQSAYSPYESDNKWQPKFDGWWRGFRSRNAHLELATTAKSTPQGFEVQGFSFRGFELRIPRSDPPPKGTARLLRWSLLLKPDGSVEEGTPTVVYSGK